jgi:hypothetical protein
MCKATGYRARFYTIDSASPSVFLLFFKENNRKQIIALKTLHFIVQNKP